MQILDSAITTTITRNDYVIVIVKITYLCLKRIYRLLPLNNRSFLSENTVIYFFNDISLTESNYGSQFEPINVYEKLNSFFGSKKFKTIPISYSTFYFWNHWKRIKNERSYFPFVLPLSVHSTRKKAVKNVI